MDWNVEKLVSTLKQIATVISAVCGSVLVILSVVAKSVKECGKILTTLRGKKKKL